MKKITTIVLCIFMCAISMAQEKMYIHKSGRMVEGVKISELDSITFGNETSTTIYFKNNPSAQYLISNLDSLSFGADSDTISIVYDNGKAYVTNPLAFENISVTVSGADVTVVSTSEVKDLNYHLSGTTSNGSFKLYSEKRFNVILNGLSLTNTDGPAINIQSSKKGYITLPDGTTNTLTDGTTYSEAATINGEAEDQKAVLFSEGELLFIGNGTLNIVGKGDDQHGICSDDYVEINGGNIIVKSATKDGIHGKEGVLITNGSVDIISNSDGIDGDEGFIDISGGSITVVSSQADTDAITCDSIINISGGTIDITVKGTGSKAIQSDQNISISGGKTTIKSSGGVTLEALNSGYDVSYCTGIKSSQNIIISDGEISITSTGTAGKGISADGDLTITGGTINISTSGSGAKYTTSGGSIDSYSASCISADGNINILDGNITTTSSGSAGKGISADGTLIFGDETHAPIINVSTSGARFSVSGSDYANPKAIKSTGALTINNGTFTISTKTEGGEGISSKGLLTINGGMLEVSTYDDAINASTDGSNGSAKMVINGGSIYCYASNNDGIDSNGTLTINGGLIISSGTSSPEEGFDCDQYTFLVNGGILIGTGGATSTPSSSSKQRTVIYGGTVAVGTYIQIKSDNGDVLVYEIPRSYSGGQGGGMGGMGGQSSGSMTLLFSSPDLTASTSFTIMTGVSVTGGTSFHGYYTNATCSEGTQAATFTTSSVVTNVGTSSSGGGGGGRGW